MSSKVEQFFDGYAVDFDAIYGTKRGIFSGVANRLFRRSMKLRFVKALEGCRPVEGKSVLDIGCGPGHYSVALARMGARSVLGVDFAEAMLEIARERAQREDVMQVCRFEKDDFLTCTFQRAFDYVIVMGFMDYMAKPDVIVRRVMELARSKAFFSFPASGGLLAWQRRLRYRRRCPLFFYNREQIASLFADIESVDITIERIDRDFFVTAARS